MRERICLEDNVLTAVTKVCDGNPGALSVCMKLILNTKKIDPDAAFDEMAHLFGLDSYGIYGSRIWMFYKVVCGEDIMKMIAVMRAVQLGELSKVKMDDAIDGHSSLDLEEILRVVKRELPKFGIVKNK